MKVMIVDDEEGFRLLVRAVAAQEGWECVECADPLAAAGLFERERPDAVMLDVMMPRMDGFEVCRAIRGIDADVPVMFLSAKGDIVDKRTGFRSGADDYLVKPFDEEELVIRLEALVRRARRAGEQTTSAECFVVGAFTFDAVRHRISQLGRDVDLTPKEFALLFTLASRAGQVIPKADLIAQVWGPEYGEEEVGIPVFVRKIREKIEPDSAKPVHLKTVWGVGYVFEG